MAPGCIPDDALPVSVRLHSARTPSYAASRNQHIRIGSPAYLPVIQTSGDHLRDTVKSLLLLLFGRPEKQLVFIASDHGTNFYLSCNSMWKLKPIEPKTKMDLMLYKASVAPDQPDQPRRLVWN
ncbi:hypothetical protein DPMN_058283 [Dreissena polymorpha]|uniref:Uncharacterized protein n=1 Tax=Dreissena polymorpha TaxID=45954 RepID=A0A9D4C1G9_DREPO|nr:hypothetical protein DPMN_058283 [Dreissena polymorpha]